MPLQNRVTPFGQIVADPARGTLMGNRGGALHRVDKRLGPARWRSKQWIICVLCFKERHRDIMSPNRYTELFFHDELVAMAAGHRPCAECQRPRYTAFRTAWAAAYGTRPKAGDMDGVLHAARVTRDRCQIRHTARWLDLPDGVFTLSNGQPALLWQRALHPWSFTGYGPSRPIPQSACAQVLTPSPTVQVLRHGYTPMPPAGLD